tara:strand:- start:339 stop:1202 length:864 start_codon:yes stop_codon:yes gene_type:complete
MNNTQNTQTKKNNLRICGGEHSVVSLQDVYATSQPARTFREKPNKRTGELSVSHQPISHRAVIRKTRNSLEDSGFSIVDECHNLARGGQRYFGLFQVDHESRKNSDRGTIIGLRNAHDKSFPAGICAGDAPFVCDNLIFTNTIKLARRHTLNILNDLNFTINRAIGQLFEFWNGQDERINAYKNREISSTEAHDLTILSCKAGALPKSKIMDVVDQWESSDHPEFWDRNVNSLYNAFTEVYKGNLTALPTRSQALHSVLDNAVNFDINNHVHEVADMAVVENELVEV